jgi:serine/threonine protein kinase
VAIKVLHEQTADRPMASARLKREFECAHALSHQNIVKVFDLDSDGTVDFFTMELLRGEHLVRILQRYGALGMARETAWVLIREIGEALAHAHERKVQ